MSKARIIHELHDDLGVTISEAEKAYNIAVEYIRLRSAIGDHPENYEPSEYVLVKASAEPESAQWVQMLINPRMYKCSNCQIAWNKRLVFENEGYSNNILMRYCPRCGRKMKTEVDYE